MSTDLAALTRPEMLAATGSLPGAAAHAGGLYRTVMRTAALEDAVARLPADIQPAWRTDCALSLPTVIEIHEDPITPGAAKAVCAGTDGARYECVRVPMGRGRTALCVSTQVGCRMGCRFCETARMGLIRQLSAAEIIGQYLIAHHRLGWPVGSIVFMGMGEPLDNWPAVRQAIRVLTDAGGIGLGRPHLNLCTIGDCTAIDRLRAEGWHRLNLSISLNAADQDLRDHLMPATRRWPLPLLRETLIAYRPRRNFLIIVNYCLLPGINDRPRDATAVAAFCRPLGRCVVNVIPYNPGHRPLTRAPTDPEVEAFITALRAGGIAVRRRQTKGRAIMAACGQLGGAGPVPRVPAIPEMPTPRTHNDPAPPSADGHTR